jgi:hypothetical protein
MGCRTVQSPRVNWEVFVVVVDVVAIVAGAKSDAR